MDSFPLVSPPKTCIRLSSHPHALHALPTSFFLIFSTEQYWVTNTHHRAFHFVVFSSPLFAPLRTKYSPQYPIFKHPQPTFLPQCERPSFTPIHNNRQNYSTVYRLYCICLNFWIANWKTKEYTPNDSKSNVRHCCIVFHKTTICKSDIHKNKVLC